MLGRSAVRWAFAGPHGALQGRSTASGVGAGAGGREVGKMAIGGDLSRTVFVPKKFVTSSGPARRCRAPASSCRLAAYCGRSHDRQPEQAYPEAHGGDPPHGLGVLARLPENACDTHGPGKCGDRRPNCADGPQSSRHDPKIYVGGHRAASRDRGAGFGANPRVRRTRTKREPRLDRLCRFQIRLKPVVTGFWSGSPARIRTSIHGSKGHKMAPDVLKRTSETCSVPHLRLLNVRCRTSRGHETSTKHTARTKPRTKLNR